MVGVIDSNSCNRFGNNLRIPLRRTRVCRPSCWYNLSTMPTTCSRLGVAKSHLIKHLSGVQNPIWIQRPSEFAHDPHLSVASELRQKRFLSDTNSVFAGDRPAQPDRFIENILEGFFDAVHLSRVLFIR